MMLCLNLMLKNKEEELAGHVKIRGGIGVCKYLMGGSKEEGARPSEWTRGRGHKLK